MFILGTYIEGHLCKSVEYVLQTALCPAKTRAAFQNVTYNITTWKIHQILLHTFKCIQMADVLIQSNLSGFILYMFLKVHSLKSNL